MADVPEGSIWIGDSNRGIALMPLGMGKGEFLRADVRLFAGSFSGGRHVYFLYGFDHTCDQIDALHSKLSGSASFPDSDYGLDVVFTAEKLGHIAVKVSAWTVNGGDARLDYVIPLDQSYLPKISRDLRAAFPNDPTAH